LQFFLGRRSARAERSSAQTGLTATTGAATQDARFPDDDLNIMVLANSGAFDYNSAGSAVYNVLVPRRIRRPHRRHREPVRGLSRLPGQTP